MHTIGVVLYTVSMWIAGIGQGLMARASNPDGTLTYAFVEIVKFNYPYYLIRFLGGALVVAGMLIMVVNVVRTFKQARGLVETPVLKPAVEAGHPVKGGPPEPRVLVEVVVDIPRLVADDEVVLALLDRVVEDHEVADQDLVHPADRLEGIELVLCGFRRDVAGFGGQLGAQRMDSLAVRLEDAGHRILGEPVDLDVRMELPQLGRDGRVAHGVSESDRR